ncbi:small-conductance mechanosensitive channel [Sorangium sp. So ce363]|uniref:small-conductance mechanosensitive channel n=1 Tax=Sorangium sp. So ce363 TaxID=3133304 RepID=UPI003F5DBB07
MATPLATRLLVHGDMPDTWGVFPPPKSPDVPGFSWFVFGLGVALALLTLGFLWAPQRFGFAAPAATRPAGVRPVPFPPWCVPGALLAVASWALMWGKPLEAAALVPFSFVPQWWGFILALDGVVYRRTGGVSLVSRRPAAVLAIAATSCVSWYFFEYLNYFTRSNWYYPNDAIFSRCGYLAWFGLAFTTVLPSTFVVYQLLTTIAPLRARFERGPQIALSRAAVRRLLWLGLLSLAALVLWPAPLFPLLWLSPLLVLTAAVSLAGAWTPFSAIRSGNWAPVVLMGLACALNYLVGEMWNFYSTPQNPNFWKYDVPYVNVLHVFEMPLLGYFGYLPFGMLCWVWWIHHAHLCGVDPAIDVVAGAGPTLARPPAPGPERGRPAQRSGRATIPT